MQNNISFAVEHIDIVKYASNKVNAIIEYNINSAGPLLVSYLIRTYVMPG